MNENIDIEKIWREYKKNPSQTIRDRIILHYLPLVKYVAGRVASGLPTFIDRRDLIEYGIFGLIEAVEKFDLKKKVKFETYAALRIKGAIIDELRSMDWVPHSTRAEARKLERTYIEMENRLKRVPKDEEVAQELGITMKELERMLFRVSSLSILSLEDLKGIKYDNGGKTDIIEAIENPRHEDDPSLVLDVSEIKSVLVNAIEKLPEKEKEIVTLFYYQGLTLKKIAEILGVSESRISQLRTKAILRLRGRLIENKERFF